MALGDLSQQESYYDSPPKDPRLRKITEADVVVLHIRKKLSIVPKEEAAETETSPEKQETERSYKETLIEMVRIIKDVNIRSNSIKKKIFLDYIIECIKTGSLITIEELYEYAKKVDPEDSENNVSNWRKLIGLTVNQSEKNNWPFRIIRLSPGVFAPILQGKPETHQQTIREYTFPTIISPETPEEQKAEQSLPYQQRATAAMPHLMASKKAYHKTIEYIIRQLLIPAALEGKFLSRSEIIEATKTLPEPLHLNLIHDFIKKIQALNKNHPGKIGFNIKDVGPFNIILTFDEDEDYSPQKAPITNKTAPGPRPLTEEEIGSKWHFNKEYFNHKLKTWRAGQPHTENQPRHITARTLEEIARFSEQKQSIPFKTAFAIIDPENQMNISTSNTQRRIKHFLTANPGIKLIRGENQTYYLQTDPEEILKWKAEQLTSPYTRIESGEQIQELERRIDLAFEHHMNFKHIKGIVTHMLNRLAERSPQSTAEIEQATNIKADKIRILFRRIAELNKKWPGLLGFAIIEEPLTKHKLVLTKEYRESNPPYTTYRKNGAAPWPMPIENDDNWEHFNLEECLEELGKWPQFREDTVKALRIYAQHTAKGEAIPAAFLNSQFPDRETQTNVSNVITEALSLESRKEFPFEIATNPNLTRYIRPKEGFPKGTMTKAAEALSTYKEESRIFQNASRKAIRRIGQIENPEQFTQRYKDLVERILIFRGQAEYDKQIIEVKKLSFEGVVAFIAKKFQVEPALIHQQLSIKISEFRDIKPPEECVWQVRQNKSNPRIITIKSDQITNKNDQSYFIAHITQPAGLELDKEAYEKAGKPNPETTPGFRERFLVPIQRISLTTKTQHIKRGSKPQSEESKKAIKNVEEGKDYKTHVESDDDSSTHIDEFFQELHGNNDESDNDETPDTV